MQLSVDYIVPQYKKNHIKLLDKDEIKFQKNFQENV